MCRVLFVSPVTTATIPFFNGAFLGAFLFGAKRCSDICPRSYLFREANGSSRAKNVRRSEQIISVGNYPSIFSRQMEAIVFIILKQILWSLNIFQVRSFENWGISHRIFLRIQPRDSLRPIACRQEYLIDYSCVHIRPRL